MNSRPIDFIAEQQSYFGFQPEYEGLLPFTAPNEDDQLEAGTVCSDIAK
jgi:hypothetical protein